MAVTLYTQKQGNVRWHSDTGARTIILRLFTLCTGVRRPGRQAYFGVLFYAEQKSPSRPLTVARIADSRMAQAQPHSMIADLVDRTSRSWLAHGAQGEQWAASMRQVYSEVESLDVIFDRHVELTGDNGDLVKISDIHDRIVL